MDKPINNDSPIMGNCLSCQGLVRVPATAPTSSTVKCPHCSESFRLSQILNHAVPALEIVEDDQDLEDDPDELAVKDADGRFVVANQLRQSSKKSRRKRRRRSRSPEATEGMVPVPKPISEAPEFASASVDEVEDTSQFTVDDSQSQSQSSRESFDSRCSRSSEGGRSRSSSSSSRSRSSSRTRSSGNSGGGNMAVEIFKVAFGGAMAIPIAYLLVLWVFRQDPLHVAPKIVKTAPFLVPAAFHVEEEAPETNDGETATGISDTERQSVEDILDVSSGLPKPRRDPGKVGIN